MTGYGGTVQDSKKVALLNDRNRMYVDYYSSYYFVELFFLIIIISY